MHTSASKLISLLLLTTPYLAAQTCPTSTSGGCPQYKPITFPGGQALPMLASATVSVSVQDVPQLNNSSITSMINTELENLFDTQGSTQSLKYPNFVQGYGGTLPYMGTPNSVYSFAVSYANQTGATVQTPQMLTILGDTSQMCPLDSNSHVVNMCTYPVPSLSNNGMVMGLGGDSVPVVFGCPKTRCLRCGFAGCRGLGWLG